ncbi:DUF3234 domain-containing protein [Thermus sp.]|uniref:DUF3234 domain-containing protein n=1 Tax=Thermus sp. TaxID=275 RepID=UPI003D0BCD5A
MAPDLSGTWYVLEGEPGEHLVVEALGERLSGIWTSRELAEAFLAYHPHLGMRVSALEGWALKEAFLTALRMLRVEAVMVDYRPGTHRAQVAKVEDLLKEVRRA